MIRKSTALVGVQVFLLEAVIRRSKTIEVGAVELLECTDKTLHLLLSAGLVVTKVRQADFYLIPELGCLFLYLADASFIERAENVLITGATGCGKSYLACALGRLACTHGYKVLYLGMTRFLEKVAQAKLEGTYVKLLNQIEKNQLIILDDFGLHPLDNTTRLALLQILEDRYAKKSIIITSQLPIKNWFEYINEPTLADAIKDRLSANANKIELKGESLRKQKSKNKS